MSDDTTGTKSKEYIRPMPANWWMMKKTYVLFIIREWTCVFVGGYAFFLLALAFKAGDPDAFAKLLNYKPLIALQVLALPMLLYHSITWINLTPKVLVVWRGEERVSPLLIAGAHFVLWAIISVVILSISCP
jgi:fumarate reductase subunit C